MVLTPRLAGHWSNARSVFSFLILENTGDPKPWGEQNRTGVSKHPEKVAKETTNDNDASSGTGRKKRKESNCWWFLKWRTWPKPEHDHQSKTPRDIKWSCQAAPLVLSVGESGIQECHLGCVDPSSWAWELVSVKASASQTLSDVKRNHLLCL